MTCACITDCILNHTKYNNMAIGHFFMVADVSLTSSIAMCLFFTGLIDIGFFKKNKLYIPLTLYFICFITVCAGWVFYY